MRALKALAVFAATTAPLPASPARRAMTACMPLPIGDAPVTANPTAYTPAINCLADYAAATNLTARASPWAGSSTTPAR